MHQVIKRVVDNGYLFEIMKDYARNAIVGFARFNGRSVGIVASQPMWLGGVIDVDSSDKMARFIRFCDLFDIPIISFVDTPAYMIGSEQEWRGILRHGAKLLYSWADATTPLIAVIVRKSYAGAHYGMLDKSIGADFVFAWPNSIVTALGGDTAASIVFAREIREAKAKDSEEGAKLEAKRIKEYRELFDNPYIAAEKGYVDDVIMPNETRKYINRALDALEDKDKDHKAYKARPWRKYSNINM
jgi:acetyl-CoA carboxylase carboxyltransferase component